MGNAGPPQLIVDLSSCRTCLFALTVCRFIKPHVYLHCTSVLGERVQLAIRCSQFQWTLKVQFLSEALVSTGLWLKDLVT